MFCPDCGYSQTAFEKGCPRCARLHARQKGCPQCGTAAPVDAPKCAKCGHAEAAIRKSFGFGGGTLGDWLLPEDEAQADQVSASISAGNVLDLSLHGVEVGDVDQSASSMPLSAHHARSAWRVCSASHWCQASRLC